MYEQNAKPPHLDPHGWPGAKKSDVRIEPERLPEIQREHEALMNELGVTSKLLSELAHKLAPILAPRPETTNAVAGLQPQTPVTQIGQSICTARCEVSALRRRIEALLDEVEV